MAVLAAPAFADLEFREIGNETNLTNETGLYLGSTPLGSLSVSVLGGGFNRTIAICSSSNQSIIQLYSFGNFTFLLSPNPVANLTEGTCRVVNVSSNFPNSTIAGNYTTLISAVSPTEVRELTVNVHVLESSVWSIVPLTPINVNKTHYGSFALAVENKGNVPISFAVQRLDSENLTFFDASGFKVDASSNLSRPVFYFVPPSTVPGLRQVNFTLTDHAGNSKVASVNLTVLDTSAPDIVEVRRSPETADIDQIVLIQVTAIDDKEVANVTLRDLLTNVSYVLEPFNATAFRLRFVDTSVPGLREFEVKATDPAGNVRTEKDSFFIQPVNALRLQNDVDVGKVRYLNERDVVVGDMLFPNFVGVRLTRFIALTPLNSTISLYLNGQDISAFNSTAVIDEHIGPIVLKVHQNPVYYSYYNGSPVAHSSFAAPNFTLSYDPADYRTEYIGELEILTSNEVNNSNPTVTFRGSFDLYSVSPARVVGVPFFANGEVDVTSMSCEPSDVGFYENSTYNCSVSFPVDIDSSELKVVTSVAAAQAERDAFDRNNTLLGQQVDGERFGKNILLFLVVGGAIVAAVWYFIFKDMHWHW